MSTGRALWGFWCLLPAGALPDADIGRDDDGLDYGCSFLLIDPLKIEFGGLSAQLDAMLVDGGERGCYELRESLVGKSEDAELCRDGDAQCSCGVDDAEGLVVGDGKNGVGPVGESEQGERGLLGPIAAEDVVDDEIIGDGQTGFGDGGDESVFPVLESFYACGASKEGDISVAFADQGSHGFKGNVSVVIDDFKTIEAIEAAVELDDGNMVLSDLMEVVGTGGLFRVGDEDAVDVLVYEGFDGFAFLVEGFMGLTDDEAVVVGKADLFNAGNGIREKALIDMGYHYADGL